MPLRLELEFQFASSNLSDIYTLVLTHYKNVTEACFRIVGDAELDLVQYYTNTTVNADAVAKVVNSEKAGQLKQAWQTVLAQRSIEEELVQRFAKNESMPYLTVTINEVMAAFQAETTEARDDACKDKICQIVAVRAVSKASAEKPGVREATIEKAQETIKKLKGSLDSHLNLLMTALSKKPPVP